MASQRSRKLRLHIFGSKVHKWLAVFVGVQALLWMATGTIMSYLKIEHIRSEHVISREPVPLGADAPLPAWATNGGDLDITVVNTPTGWLVSTYTGGS